MHRSIVPALAALAACSGPARVEVDPATLQFHARGQSARVRAVALAANGRSLPEKTCAWTSDDPRIATVAPSGNEVTVSAAGPGRTTVRCKVGGVSAEVAVAIRVIARVEARPAPLLLHLRDQPEPAQLSIQAFDDQGVPATPRRLTTRCLDENVCRGDDRGQVWAVGAGSSTVVVEADGARAEIAARVDDARSAAGKPRAVKGNPMLEYEKAAEIIQREQRKAAEGR